jgi:hypothetical protein
LTLPALASHAAKWPGMFARLLLIFHAIEMVDRPQPAITLTATNVETAARCYRFMRGYAIPHAEAFYDIYFGGRSGNDKVVKWVAGYLLAHKADFITARDLKRACRLVRKDDDLLDKIMTALERKNWVGPAENSPASLRPSKRWPINQIIYTRFVERAEYERESRAKAYENIKSKTKGKNGPEWEEERWPALRP